LDKPALLPGKKIFITGGTSRLGQAFVQHALREGAHVFFSYFKAQPIAEQLSCLGARAYALDLNNSASYSTLARELEKDAGHLDALIHNAASVRDATLQMMTETDWDEVLNADLKAPFLLTQKLLPLLTSRREPATVEPAKILFLTSRAAFRGSFGAANYAAAKAGLIGLVKSLALELASVPVLVNAVNPGFMISGMTENLPEPVKEIQRKASALERFSNPEEVADFLTYLVSDRMTQVTGQVLHWDSRSMNF
jgi:3-oxoacyl-[acyl-carrier protein] reductase